MERKIHGLLSFHLGIDPDGLDPDVVAEKWRQLCWVLEVEAARYSGTKVEL